MQKAGGNIRLLQRIEKYVIPSQCAHIYALRAAYGGCAPKRACGRSGVGISPDFQTFLINNFRILPIFRGLPHQPAGWFAMTSSIRDFFYSLNAPRMRSVFAAQGAINQNSDDDFIIPLRVQHFSRGDCHSGAGMV